MLKRKRRTAAFALVLCMTVAMLPATAFAADTDSLNPVGGVTATAEPTTEPTENSKDESSTIPTEPTEDSKDENSAIAPEPTENSENESYATQPAEDENKPVAYAETLPYVNIGGTVVTEENKANILGDGTCSFDYNNELSQWELTLNNATLSNSYILANTATNYAIKLIGENKITAKNYAIRVSGNLTIAGTGSLAINTTIGLPIEVVFTSALIPSGNLTISDGVSVDCSSQYQAIATSGNLNITGASVTANTTEPYNSVITAQKDCTISGGTVTATATGKSTNAIKCNGKTVIKEKSTVTLSSAKDALITLTDLNISDSSVIAKSSNSTAISASNGNITIEGDNTSVEAVSTSNSAIFTKNGKISLLTDNITATGANGFAAIVARVSSNNNTGEIVNNIILGDKLAANKNHIIGATVWQGSYYSDTAFVPANTALPLNDLSAAPNSVSISIAGANYDTVDAALKKVPADLTLYTDETVSALNAAINAVNRNKTAAEQEAVNNYAVAIENAINALVLKPVLNPVSPTVTSKPTFAPTTVSPKTGDNFNSVLWISIFSASLLTIVFTIWILKKKNHA